MSRIGKKPITIPNKVEVKVAKGAEFSQINIKGPKGTINLDLPGVVNIEQKDQELILTVLNPDDGRQKAIWGMARALLNNAVQGVDQGFVKNLEINGVGFKAAAQGKKLVLNIGFSHPVDYHVPEGINITVEKNIITVSGVDRQLVGQTAAEIRHLKKPEPYKGKGIKYSDEVIRRKAGKVVKS